MSDETAPVGDTVSIPLPADAPAAMSVSDAARLLSQARRKQEQAPPPVESAPQATTEPELAVEADAAPPQEATGETQESDPAELPPLDLPRSWTKEQAEHWNALPRSVQEYLSERASKDSEAVRRSQNEAAEAKKAFEAQIAQAEQVRKDYEAKLPTLVKTIESALQQEFGDIQSIADVRKLQAEDPFRFQAWQLRQMELAAAQQEQQAAEQRQTHEKQSAWQNYVQAESKAFEDDVPEFKQKKAEYTNKAGEALRSLGYSQEELNRLANGDDKLALYDRRVQRLLFDHIRLNEMREAPAKAIPKPVPPVQRPGVAKGGNPSVAQQIQALNQQLETATGNNAVKLAAQLTALKRQAAR